MLREKVQNLINNLEGPEFNLNGFNCKVENGNLHWGLGSPEGGILDLDSMDEKELSELYNELIDIEI